MFGLGEIFDRRKYVVMKSSTSEGECRKIGPDDEVHERYWAARWADENNRIAREQGIDAHYFLKEVQE